MNILFTGGRSGIAKATIDKLLTKDYTIFLTVRTDEQLKRVLEEYKDIKNVKCFKLDITDNEDRKKIEKLDIDILVSNASVCYGGSISEIPFEYVRDNFNVNVFGTFELIQIVLKNMIKKDKGRIIIMGSLAGVMPLNFMGVYCSTKSAVNTLATTLKNEMKLISNNIDIILIEPGLYHTGFNQLMAENKYDWMQKSSYFKKQIPKIKAKEKLIFELFEKEKLNSITDKIIEAIETDKPSFIYRAPSSHVIASKIYDLLNR